MNEISIDLSKQACPVFNLKHNSELIIQNKNFIFGKNGAGKSTLSSIILDQFQHEYDVRIFTGFDNILVDKKLNAVVLGEENIEKKKEIENLDEEISSFIEQKTALLHELCTLDWKPEYEEKGILKNGLFVKTIDTKENCESKNRELDKFYQEIARKLKQQTNPQITKTTYYKSDFINDITNAKELTPDELKQCITVLSEQAKSEISPPTINPIDLRRFFDRTNELVQHHLEETVIIDELKDDSEKKAFANQGRRIHHSGENCAFCGNTYTAERSQMLERYFSGSALKEYQESLNTFIAELKNKISDIDSIELLEINDFYSPFTEAVKQCNISIKKKKQEITCFLNILLSVVQERLVHIFDVKKTISTEIPDNLDAQIDIIDELILNNNEFTKNIEAEHKKNMEQVRLHYVFVNLCIKEEYKAEWKGYEVEKYVCNKLNQDYKIAKDELESRIQSVVGNKINPEQGTICYIQEQLNIKEEVKVELLRQTRNTSKLAENINTKLRSAGKHNLQLELQKESDEIEYYLVKDRENGVRPIDQVSTGERNIIAFLYFIESLSVVNHIGKKILIFDDPMNSNDDTMQYLIITEIQKLYQGKNRTKFNPDRDYFICLTHNAHFYLNVQPQGYFKEKKQDPNDKTKLIEVSKYDKNNFYWVSNGKFHRIMSEKEDLNTHYDVLWIELKSLYENDLINSMLNSMRRIIETYTKFNKINPQKFYKDKEEHQKLFNVNSHSIDDLSAELVGQTKEDLLNLFLQLFIDNDAKTHFDSYWKE